MAFTTSSFLATKPTFFRPLPTLIISSFKGGISKGEQGGWLHRYCLGLDKVDIALLSHELLELCFCYKMGQRETSNKPVWCGEVLFKLRVTSYNGVVLNKVSAIV